ncbi:MAG TPA: hypothetical protein VMU63_11345 [Acidimicrobiales bacterium]|nr:hypothetical protein [Acidimicrobiales bacterium]
MTEAVCLELGRRKVFACSLRWPGWCRWAADESSALAARRVAWHVLDHAWEMQDRST